MMLTTVAFHPAHAAGAVSAGLAAAGARGDCQAMLRWLGSALDHSGRGMLLVGEGQRVLHSNRLALLAMGPQHPLMFEHGCVRARAAEDAAALGDALDAALRRSLRRLVNLGPARQRLAVAVLPIGSEGDTGPAPAALISMPQSCRRHDLSVQAYARLHAFTAAETAVLEALLAGREPTEIAATKGVKLSTVRTQIGQLRYKTGARSIRDLLDRVLALPPMLAVVQ
jgi:DNA-binding CsgD family transcriptional regulator